MANGCPIAAARALPAHPWTAVAATVGVKLGFACCFAAFFFYGFDWITDAHEERFTSLYETWDIAYPRGGEVVSAPKNVAKFLEPKNNLDNNNFVSFCFI